MVAAPCTVCACSSLSLKPCPSGGLTRPMPRAAQLCVNACLFRAHTVRCLSQLITGPSFPYSDFIYCQLLFRWIEQKFEFGIRFTETSLCTCTQKRGRERYSLGVPLPEQQQESSPHGVSLQLDKNLHASSTSAGGSQAALSWPPLTLWLWALLPNELAFLLFQSRSVALELSFSLTKRREFVQAHARYICKYGMWWIIFDSR